MSEEEQVNTDKYDPAPRWLAEMRASDVNGDRVDRPHGFYVNYRHFAAVHIDRGDDRLVVAFDNLSSVNDESLDRETWGDKFYADNGWSSLGIISFEANWYRDEVLFDYLEQLRDSGFFARFKDVVFTGTSMGGYAACAFSSLAPGSTVIAYSPQSTLKKELVPWEKRFNRGRQQDWSGRYADSTECTGQAKKVYLCYDPYFEGDKEHAARYSGDNIVHLHSNYVGHKTVVFLRRAGILKDVTGGCISGEMTPARFNGLYRARRKLPWYYFALLDLAVERGHRKLSDMIIRKGSDISGNPNLTRVLRGRRQGIWDRRKAEKAQSDKEEQA
jgi:hypothetical protein